MTRHHATALLLSMTTLACGSTTTVTSSNPAPSPTPVPAAPSTVVAGQGTFSLPAATRTTTWFAVRPFTTFRAGSLVTTVDYTHAASELWMYLAEGECTVDQFKADECPHRPECACRFSLRSEAESTRPRVLSIPDAPAGPRTLVIWNVGPTDEAGAYQAVLTSAAGASGGGATAVGRDAVPGVGNKTQPRR